MSAAKPTSPARCQAVTAGVSDRRAGDRPRILVCDQDSQTLHALRVVLQNAGFWIDPARTAAAALSHGYLRVPDAAIIELVLPDGDGVEVCRCLREWSAMPLIVLSSVNEEREQVRALEAGADDYVTKPFRAGELVARLRANLRRAMPRTEEPCVELQGLEIDLGKRSVRREGEEIHLTPIEFKLLAAFLRNRGRVLTHRALLQEVWGAAYVNDTQTLRNHIANLRRKIETAEGPRLICTNHRIGYRLADGCSEPPTPARPTRAAIDPSPARGRLVGLQAPSPVATPPRRRSADAYGRVA